MNGKQKAEILQIIIDSILDGLQKQAFHDWYNNKFEAFISGGDEMKEELGTESRIIAQTIIKQDIIQLFHLV